MNKNLTIIYYTSNKEKPEFERKVRQNILRNCGGLPIISVSQKPIDFGHNICVGDVGASGFNVCRQIQTACKAAKTKFIINTEADCLYPPDYFTFEPERDDICYRNNNIYLAPYKKNFYLKKSHSLFSQVIGREFFIDRLNYLFKNQPQWNTEMKNFPKEIGEKLFNKFEYYKTENPCVSFKTGYGMRKYSASGKTPVYEIPYWGNIKNLRKKYLTDKKSNIRFRKAYTTHMPMLIKAVQLTKGPVMELGSGLFSTPLLHWLCKKDSRKLVTYENMLEYYPFARQFRSRNHHVRLIDSWDKIDVETHWSVVMIDHKPAERRAIDAIRLRDKADYIVLHDTERSVYGYDKIWPHFKYIYHWKSCKPWTTVVSNFKNLNEEFTNIHKSGEKVH